MKIENIKIENFKRFFDLDISDIPKSAKIVLLTGPNGSGKTSLFEAFNYWVRSSSNKYSDFDGDYFLRNKASKDVDQSGVIQKINLAKSKLNDIKIKFFNMSEADLVGYEARKKSFYIRSAYRNTPDFKSDGLGKVEDALAHSNNPAMLILSESRVHENYQRMASLSFSNLYDEKYKNKTAGEITDEILGEVRKAMSRVFEELILEGPGNPLEGGTFRFTKGNEKNFHYKNLSGGEKAAFDILLDFIIKCKSYDDTVFCIDEPELHMHTRLQAKLLEVIFELIPEKCQLWISTHSIGMARKASELQKSSPGEVSFIDFHEKNFDQSVSIKPTYPDRDFWKRMFSTALDDLADLVVPKYVVFCEGKKLALLEKNIALMLQYIKRFFQKKIQI